MNKIIQILLTSFLLGAFVAADVAEAAKSKRNGGHKGPKNLRQLNCEAGEIPKFNGRRWKCSTDLQGDTSALQIQIDELIARVDALQANTEGGLVFSFVDCTAGESISAAIDNATNPIATLVIIVTGLCDEEVNIDRDVVLVPDETSTASFNGISSTNAPNALVVQDRAKAVVLDLHIEGGSDSTVRCASGGHFVAVDQLSVPGDMTIKALTNMFTVITAEGYCNLYLEGVVADANNLAGHALWMTNSVANTVGGRYINATAPGIWVQNNASFFMGDLGDYPAPTTVENSQAGIAVSFGAIVTAQKGLVQNNNDFGFTVVLGGKLAQYAGDTLTVANNGGDGLQFQTGALANFGSGDFNVTGNGGFGVQCDSTLAAFFFGAPFNITGNAGGDVDPICPTGF